MRILCHLLIFNVLAASAAMAAGGIVVNEYYSGSVGTVGSTAMAGSDYIEFALTQNMTSAALAALTFGDTNSSTSSFSGVFQFDKSTLDNVLSSAGRTSFLAGSIIVVAGANYSQNLTYTPASTNITNNDAWSIVLVAGQGAKSDSDFKKGGDISFSISGDAVWVSTDNPPSSTTDTSSLISGLAHTDDSLGTVGTAIKTQFGSSHIYNGSQPYGNSISNTGTDAATVLSLVSGGTMANPNGGINTTWINGLRAVALTPEPTRVLLVLLGFFTCFLKRQRPNLHLK